MVLPCPKGLQTCWRDSRTAMPSRSAARSIASSSRLGIQFRLSKQFDHIHSIVCITTNTEVVLDHEDELRHFLFSVPTGAIESVVVLSLQHRDRVDDVFRTVDEHFIPIVCLTFGNLHRSVSCRSHLLLSHPQHPVRSALYHTMLHLGRCTSSEGSRPLSCRSTSTLHGAGLRLLSTLWCLASASSSALIDRLGAAQVLTIIRVDHDDLGGSLMPPIHEPNICLRVAALDAGRSMRERLTASRCNLAPTLGARVGHD